MQSLAKKVLEYAAALPEGAPIAAKELLHFSSRAAVDQALSRLVRRGALIRAGRGIYVLPVESRFGTRNPSTAKIVEGLAIQRGETIVASGAAAANTLGLTNQVPVREVYLTSGSSRRLSSALRCRVPACSSLAAGPPGRNAGDVVRALAGWGQREPRGNSATSQLPSTELQRLLLPVPAYRPGWQGKLVHW
jgi:hypothetical protein